LKLLSFQSFSKKNGAFLPQHLLLLPLLLLPLLVKLRKKKTNLMSFLPLLARKRST